ncbi:MAG: cytochrome c biogenesis protein CcsA [Rhodospirillaceae bacterium]|nr:cytochrome c biogenesis protein CcsA [Rhodospirillaceae bacterium]MBL6930365.1 cytochrome c biogenesis protein CcsA [Rhodospirillales bacterium]MBL6942002.1 cytochrome c biogenesis protein CcsA [Rhodospirillales bacterium]
MMEEFLISLSAFAALLPSAFVALRRRDVGRGDEGRDGTFWLTLAVAVSGPLVWVIVKMSGAWQTGLSTTLWVTIAASMMIFAVLTVLNDKAWRLTPLLVPYMAVLAVFAIIWQQAPVAHPLINKPGGWVEAHILVSVATYALVTIAAVAALAAFLQERGLKAKQPTSLTRILPSVAESESLLVRLLIIGEVVLGLGLVTGMATHYQETGHFIAWDHKAILSLTAFVVIGGLLSAHFISGVRGRRVTRIVLLAYLLLTLGYPGVKFVTDVLIG